MVSPNQLTRQMSINTKNIAIFAGSASLELAGKIAEALGINLGDMQVEHFADGEFSVYYKDSIRGKDVFLVQSTYPSSDNIMELLLMVDAAKRASAHYIAAVIPYFGWARQDRKDKPRVSIGAKLMADLLSTAGATRVMLGLPVEKPNKNLFDLDYVGIKASQFSFNRLQKADPVLGVDMASTGEVGCLGDDTNSALLTSMLSVGHRIPKKTVLLSTGGGKQKAEMLDAAKRLVNNGYELYATSGTSHFLTENGIANTTVYWPTDEGMEPKVLDVLREKKIDMVVNIPKDLTPRELTNGYSIRRAAIDLNIPLITNTRLASAFITAFTTMRVEDIEIKAWSEYK